LFYSTFIFFVGYYSYSVLTKRSNYFIVALTPFFIFSGERLSLALSFFSLSGRSKWIAIIFVSVSLLAHAAYMGVSTPVVVLLASLILVYFRGIASVFLSFGVFGWVGLLVLLAAIGSVFYFDVYQGFLHGSYGYFGDDVDNNAYWRLMYWLYLITSNFNEFLVTGIGFGTKLFDLGDTGVWWIVPSELSRGNELIEYVLGPHNSLVFIFKRTGLLGIYIFLMFLFHLMKLAFESRNPGLICCLVVLNVNLVFNVILESPLWSINYWFMSGMCYAQLLRYRNV
jgi:hypothetical protein